MRLLVFASHCGLRTPPARSIDGDVIDTPPAEGRGLDARRRAAEQPAGSYNAYPRLGRLRAGQRSVSSRIRAKEPSIRWPGTHQRDALHAAKGVR